MKRRQFSLSLAAAGLVTHGAGAWAQPGTPVEGQDYTRINPPVPQNASGKVEVIEFFSYACPHCNAFEPTLQAWVRQLPADVAFRRVPVPFLMNADNFQRAYYTLESLGLVDKMQSKVFAAVHVDKQRLDKPEDIAALVAKNGGDGARFLAAFKSFSVVTAAGRAKTITAEYKIDGVPTLGIQGRYLTSPSMASGAERSLAVADMLIARSRKA